MSDTEQLCWETPVFLVPEAKKGVIQGYYLLPSCYLSRQRFQLNISQILQNLTNSETNISLQTVWSDEQLSLHELGNKITKLQIPLNHPWTGSAPTVNMQQPTPIPHEQT